MVPETAFLKKIYIFQDLDMDEVAAVSEIMTAISYQANQVIMEEGAQGHSMFVIGRGEIKVNKALTMKFGHDDFRETEKTLSILRAEDYVVFGEMSLVTDSERSASVTTRTECILYEITRERFLKLARSRPNLGFKVTFRLAELLAQRLKSSVDDVIRLTTALSIALSQ